MWWQALLGLLVVYLGFVIVLWRLAPDELRLQEALRLLPDVLRLVGRLARDASLPRALRWRLWLLVGYLTSPIDLVPDFLPVIGYADDAVLILWTLRSVLRTAGPEALERHWPGTADGLSALRRTVRS